MIFMILVIAGCNKLTPEAKELKELSPDSYRKIVDSDDSQLALLNDSLSATGGIQKEAMDRVIDAMRKTGSDTETIVPLMRTVVKQELDRRK